MAAKRSKTKLSSEQRDKLLKTLAARFEKNTARHKGIKWADVEKRIKASPAKLSVLADMEETGGEPDVIGKDKKTGGFIFADCSAESPKGRRSICYDKKARESRKENKPKDSAQNMADEMGVEMMTEEEYRDLQKLGEFDLKTSSWIVTPEDIRKRGGALFCDRRYGHVFTYHNGAESYYAARGFRGLLRV